MADRIDNLHIVATGGLYGIEQMLVSLLPALERRGVSSALACLAPPAPAAPALSRALRACGIRVVDIDSGAGLDFRALLQLRRVIWRCRPQVLHVHGYKATIIGGLLRLLHRVPIVATCHTEARRYPELAHHARVEGVFLRRLDGVAAVSASIQRELVERRVPAHVIRVIANGITIPSDSDAWWTRPADWKHAIAFVGRLVELKNVDVLIRAVHRLSTEIPSIGLAIAGEGPVESDLRRLTDRLGAQNNVRFLGYIDNVGSFLSACDSFVLPSRIEGMPIALLEAMSCGLPIVASTVGSIPDIVTHGRDALLVEPNNIDAVVDGLRLLLGDPELRRRLGDNARARYLSEYTADRMASRYIDFYTSLSSLRARAPGRFAIE